MKVHKCLRRCPHLRGGTEGPPKDGRVRSAAPTPAHLAEDAEHAARHALLRFGPAAAVAGAVEQQPHAEALAVVKGLQHDVQEAVVLARLVGEAPASGRRRLRKPTRGNGTSFHSSEDFSIWNYLI